VTRASEVIAHLLPRKAAPLLERITGLPYGWGLWLRGQAVRRGALTQERPAAVTAWALARGPGPSPGVLPALSRWQALRSLLYQHWDPPPREERGLRWFAGTFSFLLHVGFALLLIVVALVRYLPPVTQREVARTQVSFLGKGTPEEEGGGAPAQEAAAAANAAEEETAASAASATSSPAGASTTPAQATPTQQRAAPAPASDDSPEQSQADATVSAASPVPPPVEPAPPTPQPPVETQQNVQVSQADQQPQQAFVLPPMTPPQLPQVQTRAPEVTVPQREVTVVERPVIRAPAVTQTTPQPILRTRQISVREREIPAPAEPLPEIRSPRPLAQREVQVRQPQAPSATVAQREIQMPEIAAPAPPTPAPAAPVPPTAAQQPASPAEAAATAQATSEQAKQASEPTTTPASQQASSASSRNAAANANANANANTSAPPADRAPPAPPGATPAPTSGSWSSPQKADDWGLADRPTPGARASDGLFNADGSVKLAGEGDGGAQDKGPPGSRQAQAIDANKAGEWLDRPPAFTYEQSKFEKYWVPNESLLQEWVRRNIRELEIPIPGTSKRIKCVVSVLQLGGGCGVYDPNLQEQPAQSRPPPQVPVKRNPIPLGS
jgi:hypothetical protein